MSLPGDLSGLHNSLFDHGTFVVEMAWNRFQWITRNPYSQCSYIGVIVVGQAMLLYCPLLIVASKYLSWADHVKYPRLMVEQDLDT